MTVRKIDTHNFTRATRTTPREINRRIVLNLVRDHQPVSRADIARRMDIGRGVVTSIIGDLIDDGTIFEGATGPAARGRRPTMLFLRTGDRLAVAIDLRFSRSFVMLSDFAANQIALESFDTIFEPARLVSELVARIARLVEAHRSSGRCEGIGLVVPGMVERESGRVLSSPQLGWRDIDIRDSLAEGTGLPVTIENAPMACALAQMWLGQRGVNSDNFAYVTVSDGVGVGIVLNGQLIRGHGNSAGEFGHNSLDPAGPQCLCGALGCWEAYTSNQATLSRYLERELVPIWGQSTRQPPPLTIDDLIARARDGDVRASSALEATGHYLGIGIAGIINALNPAQIFVGGEVTVAWDLIQPALHEGILERALTRAAASTPVVPELRGGSPRLRGATALVAAPHFAAPALA
ncbi:MAG: ROK family transcriptional regulator [Gemmatimonadaceae bacterium]|nr:ROK family transcriptional regulator [Gemmatimonadaceae bacterium]